MLCTHSRQPRYCGDCGCLDLRTIARPRRWRWRLEESYKAEQDSAVRGDGRWYVEILCKRGLIYPWGEDDLVAFTGVRGTAERLLALDPAVRRCQSGDRENTLRFPSCLLDRVAEVMEPRVKRAGRPLSAAMREGLKRWSQSRKSALGSTIASPDDLEVGSGALRALRGS